MISAGEVGASFTVVDNATAVLSRIAAEFDKVQASTDKAIAALKELRVPAGTLKALQDISAQMVKIDEASAGFGKSFAGLGAAAEEGASGVAVGMGRIDTSLKATMEQVAVLKREMATLSVGGAPGAVAAAAGGGGYRGYGPGRAPTGGGHLSSGRGIPVGDTGIHASGDGTTGFLVGLGILDAFKHAIEDSMNQTHASLNLEASGFGPADMVKARAAAASVADSNQMTTIAGNIQTLQELNKANKGNLDQSIAILPMAAQMSAALASVRSDDIRSKYDSGKDGLDLGRYLEETAVLKHDATPAQNAENVRKREEMLLKTVIWSRGQVNPESLFGMTNNSGGMAMNWGADFATVTAPIIGMELKAGKFGNADYMMGRAFDSGRMTQPDLEALQKSGLADPSDFHKDRHGLHLNRNSEFAAGFDDDPWAWSAKMLDKLKSHGMNTSDQHVMDNFVNSIGGSKSLQQMMRVLFEPDSRALIEGDRNARGRVSNDAAGFLAKNDPLQAIEGVKNAFTDAMAAIGNNSGPAVAGLQRVAAGLRSVADFGEAHPTATGYAAATGIGGALYGMVASAIRWMGYGGNSSAGVSPRGPLLPGEGPTGLLGAGSVGGALRGGVLGALATLIGGVAIDRGVQALSGTTDAEHARRQAYSPSWAPSALWDDLKTVAGAVRDAIIPSAHAAEQVHPALKSPFGSLGTSAFAPQVSASTFFGGAGAASKPVAITPATGAKMGVTVSDALRIGALPPITGNVVVTGAVSVTNLGEIAGMLASAVGGAVQSAVAGMHIPNQSASSDDHGTFHSPDVSFG